MRIATQWPISLREWLPGLAVSVPMVVLLLITRSSSDYAHPTVAAFSILLSIPWIVPIFILITALSAPIYAWLHTQGPVPDVLFWLGHAVLVASVIGCHVNAALAIACWRAYRKSVPEPGLGDFLRRTQRR